MDPTTHQSQRSRQRSESPSSPTRVHKDERDRDYYLRIREEFRAEAERRSRLPVEERMTEDGREVLRRLEQEPTTTILLQPSPPSYMSRAGCAAGKCAITDASAQGYGRPIMDDYRIVLGSRNQRYFHVSCVEMMVDLASLAP
jgi:hypothetical protein